ncbi:MAG: hypothetical protein KGL52_11750 [Rhodospirillales bacterium]|nr:hypothetical protein [Rhodospirillales bacterium]
MDVLPETFFSRRSLWFRRAWDDRPGAAGIGGESRVKVKLAIQEMPPPAHGRDRVGRRRAGGDSRRDAGRVTAG